MNYYDTIDLNTVLGILRRQRRLILGIVLAIVGLALAYLLMATPIYKASTLIEVDGRSSNLLDPSATGQEQSAILNSRVDSEVEVLRSSATTLAVVRAADLVKDDEFGPRLGWLEKLGIALGTELDGNSIRRVFGLSPTPTATQEQLVNSTLLKLQDAVDIRRRGLTYLIEIGVSSESPQRAAEIANQYAKTYIERQVATKAQSAVTARDVVRRQIETAQEQLAASETAINTFIEGNLTRLEAETNDPAIGKLRETLNAAKSEQADRRSKIASADTAIAAGDWAAVADTLGDEAITELARQRTELEARLNKVETGSDEAVDLRNQLAGLDENLRSQSSASMVVMQQEMKSLGDRESQARDQLRGLLLESDISAELLTDLYNLQQSSTVARNQYQTLLAREQDLGALANLQIADARVVSEAYPPNSPDAPKKKLILLMALVAGSGLGFSLAFLREFYVGGIVESSQLSNIIQMPVPVSLGMLDQVKNGIDPADLILDAPMSLYSETFRKLRASIDIGLGMAPAKVDNITAHRGKVILVCSSLQAEGKSTIAIALARTYAMAGVNTLLIDADLRKPSVAKRLNMPNSPGLIDFIGLDNSSDTIKLNPRRDPLSPLIVITAGQRSTRPTDQILNGAAFQGVMDVARERFDVIIIDSPPILPVVDTRYLAGFADAIALIVRYATTTQSEVREAVGQLRDHMRKDAHMVGILNLEERGDTRYGYYSNYGYYGDDAE